jgi:hypothetical protein
MGVWENGHEPMNMKTAILVSAAIGAFCLAAQTGRTASAADSKPHDFVLTITGTDGLAFTGNCKLRTADGDVDVPLDGMVPEHHEIRGTGLKCLIEKAGRDGTITVEVMRDGQIVSYNSNSGSSGIFNVSVR